MVFSTIIFLFRFLPITCLLYTSGQKSRAVGDHAVQRPGRDHKICSFVRIHQGGDARRDHRHAQRGRVQMLCMIRLRRVQPGVGELHAAAQPRALGTAKALSLIHI